MNAKGQHDGLGAAFAPDRAAGLAGLLVPKTREAPSETTTQQVPAKNARQARAPRARTSTKHDPAGEIVVSVPIYLTPATLDKAAELCRARHTTYADLAIEAFTAIPQADLIDYFATRPPKPNKRGIPVAHPRARPGHGVQRQFRFQAEARDWVKAEVKAVAAPSVSALVAAVMGMHLGTLPGLKTPVAGPRMVKSQ